jgi:hypothetical protein
VQIAFLNQRQVSGNQGFARQRGNPFSRLRNDRGLRERLAALAVYNELVAGEFGVTFPLQSE